MKTQNVTGFTGSILLIQIKLSKHQNKLPTCYHFVQKMPCYLIEPNVIVKILNSNYYKRVAVAVFLFGSLETKLSQIELQII